MSSGPFETGRYECTATTLIHAIKVQPETKALTIAGTANAYPTGAINGQPSAKVSGGRREIGINARTVTVKMTAAGGGLSVGSKIRLPWFDADTFAGLVKGQTGTYLGAACELIGRGPESVQ